jgi:hypothetical protein
VHVGYQCVTVQAATQYCVLLPLLPLLLLMLLLLRE